MANFITAIFLALQLADGWTTYQAIKRGAGRERNPVVRRFIDRLGLFWGLAALKLSGSTVVVYGWANNWWTGVWLWLLAAVTFGYVLVVANNWRVLHRRK